MSNHPSLTAQHTLFRFNRVPVIAQPSFWPLLLAVWGILSWIAGARRPRRPWPQRLLVGVLALPLALSAEIGHALAHTISARYAGAPMNRILLSSGMPRTLYTDNAVSPTAHRLRAMGGPIYNALGVALSFVWRRRATPRSLNRELADVACASHGLLLIASLAPVPIVDGGVLLKWTLVARGEPSAAADQAVHRVSQTLGIVLASTGAALILWRRKFIGGLLCAAGTAALAAGLDLLR
ncbi:MAG: hypothetical protein DCC57_07995 [Chloroflexi bacterium]|nr:MAG: hypothetical protein DCC57_07995 [Chloroflexota bacterium]